VDYAGLRKRFYSTDGEMSTRTGYCGGQGGEVAGDGMALRR
jgi:hypothetical protein